MTSHDWPYPPAEGWTAPDLDAITALDGPEAAIDYYKHVELIDGALVVRPSMTRYETEVIRRLVLQLSRQAPAGLEARSRMAVRIHDRQQPEPDLIVLDSVLLKDPARTYYPADAVTLLVEVVSPESEIRDRERKPQIYAKAGIRHFWRIENDDWRPIVYVYELDPATSAYALTGIHHDRVSVTVPFPIEADLTTSSKPEPH